MEEQEQSWRWYLFVVVVGLWCCYCCLSSVLEIVMMVFPRVARAIFSEARTYWLLFYVETMAMDIPNILWGRKRCELHYRKKSSDKHPPISFFTPDLVTCCIHWVLTLTHMTRVRVVLVEDSVTGGGTTARHVHIAAWCVSLFTVGLNV